VDDLQAVEDVAELLQRDDVVLVEFCGIEMAETGSPSRRAASYSTRYMSGDSGRISILPSAFGSAACTPRQAMPSVSKPSFDRLAQSPCMRSRSATLNGWVSGVERAGPYAKRPRSPVSCIARRSSTACS